MAGRKPIYKPENLQIGEKMAIPGKRRFGHQYARSFNRRFNDKEFKFVDGAYIERVK